MSDHDGDGEGTMEGRGTTGEADFTRKKPAYVFDPDLLNWNLDATIGMQQDFAKPSSTATHDTRGEPDQEHNLINSFPWSDLAFTGTATPELWASPMGVRQKDGQGSGGGYNMPSTPLTRSGDVTPAFNIGDDDERVIVTARCTRDKLSSLMEAMMGVVDSVAVEKSSEGTIGS